MSEALFTQDLFISPLPSFLKPLQIQTKRYCTSTLPSANPQATWKAEGKDHHPNTPGRLSGGGGGETDRQEYRSGGREKVHCSGNQTPACGIQAARSGSLWVRGSFWEAGKEALLSQTTTYTPLMGWLENVVEHRPWLPGSLAHGAERGARLAGGVSQRGWGPPISVRSWAPTGQHRSQLQSLE